MWGNSINLFIAVVIVVYKISEKQLLIYNTISSNFPKLKYDVIKWIVN
jgi:hypothetical protein